MVRTPLQKSPLCVQTPRPTANPHVLAPIAVNYNLSLLFQTLGVASLIANSIGALATK